MHTQLIQYLQRHIYGTEHGHTYHRCFNSFSAHVKVQIHILHTCILLLWDHNWSLMAEARTSLSMHPSAHRHQATGGRQRGWKATHK